MKCSNLNTKPLLVRGLLHAASAFLLRYRLMSKTNADVIVVGLGAMGSAACYQLAKRGASVIGIDRYSPPHTLGSTHGETRITRQAIGEGEHFVPFALRSYEIWRELEAETGNDLLTITGGLIMSAESAHSLHGNADFLQTTIDAAEKFGIRHRVLDASAIASAFPQFEIAGDERAYFEDEAGFLRPEACVATQLRMAEKLGATLRLNETVTRLEHEGRGVRVVTDRGSYSASAAIVAAGPWVHEFVDDVPKSLFKIYRQVLYWFDVSEVYEQYAIGNFPIFIWSFGRWADDYCYGFPAIDGSDGGLKIASENFTATTTPSDADRIVTEPETAAMYDSYVSGKLSGIGRNSVRSAVCLYTVTPNCNFIIDRVNENVILASPCSGHGFKHSAAIGETLAELALIGQSKIDISRFSLNQF
ncbi:MAG TPA: N-methyl-L-tryptophan oxidase [Pyrinomonadaceae bacterium]|nr:N-methyl-L-tryptophan oxidase [Pyrinomonadaceae bacterium]